MSGLGVLACSNETNLNYWITMLFIHNGTNKLWQTHIIKKKAHLLKFTRGNYQQGWSQVTFLNRETPAYQFKDECGISTHFVVIS